MNAIKKAIDRNSFNTLTRPETGVDWYDEEVQRDLRLKRALNAEAAAAENAAKMATAMADGMDVQSAHMDRIERARTSIIAHVTLYEDPELDWVQRQMLRDRCYSASRNLKWCMDKLQEQIGKVDEILRNHRGGDIDDERLVRATEFCQRKEFEIEAWKDELEAAGQAYKTLTGDEWLDSPDPDKQAALKKRQTAAASTAQAMLERYRKSA